MAVKDKNALYRVSTTGGAHVLDPDGNPLYVPEGELIREGHWLIKALGPANVTLADDVVRYDTEQATAAPGEKRGEK